ncbi:hypothetical protein H0H92_010047, partial [Tricholoma furcatifolium]
SSRRTTIPRRTTESQPQPPVYPLAPPAHGVGFPRHLPRTLHSPVRVRQDDEQPYPLSAGI